MNDVVIRRTYGDIGAAALKLTSIVACRDGFSILFGLCLDGLVGGNIVIDHCAPGVVDLLLRFVRAHCCGDGEQARSQRGDARERTCAKTSWFFIFLRSFANHRLGRISCAVLARQEKGGVFARVFASRARCLRA